MKVLLIGLEIVNVGEVVSDVSPKIITELDLTVAPSSFPSFGVMSKVQFCPVEVSLKEISVLFA